MSRSPNPMTVTEMARKGGRSRSKAKLAAVRANAAKARDARMMRLALRKAAQAQKDGPE